MTFQDLGINVRRNSGTESCVCPKCSADRKPEHRKDLCLFIHHEKKFGYCYNCEWSVNLEYEEKNQKIREQAKYPKREERQEYTPAFKSYWINRGISEATLKKAFIYERQMKIPGAGVMGSIMCFPQFKYMQLVNVKFRPIKEPQEGRRTMWMVKKDDGAELILQGVDFVQGLLDNEVKQIEDVILVEGEPDMLSYREVGFERIIWLPNGTKSLACFTEPVIKMLNKVKTFYLALNSDGPGIQCRDEVARRLMKERCRIVTFPEPATDANDVIHRQKCFPFLTDAERHAKLKETIRTAKPYPISGIYSVSNFGPELLQVYEMGYPEGYRTDISKVDRHFRLFTSTFMVVTGVPSTGKSSLIKRLIPEYKKWADANNKQLKAAVYDQETKKAEWSFAKLITAMVGRPIIPGQDNQMGRQQLFESMKKLDDYVHLIRPGYEVTKGDTKGNRLESILEYARICVVAYGCNWLIIDNWTTIEKDFRKGETMDVYVGRSLNQICDFASKYDVNVTLIAHPTKIEKDTHGNYKLLNLQNISGSVHFDNFADIGIALHRDLYRQATEEDESEYAKQNDGRKMPKGAWIRDYSLPTRVDIVKLRETWMGQKGSFDVWMDLHRDVYVFNKNELHKENKTVEYKKEALLFPVDDAATKPAESVDTDLIEAGISSAEDDLPF